VGEEDTDRTNRDQANGLLLVNAMKCVKSTKIVWNELRDHGWESLLVEVHDFCEKRDIEELDMEQAYVNPKKRRQVIRIANKNHYQVDFFNDVLDWLVIELDGRFRDTSSNLLVWSAALSPRDSFHNFNLESLINLAKLYPQDFDSEEMRDLDQDLRLYNGGDKEAFYVSFVLSAIKASYYVACFHYYS
jgi:hypothetical protein